MLLIDTGMPGNAKKIAGYISALGKKPCDLEYVILTHADIDHTGSAAELRKITGARLAIHTDDAPILSGRSKTRAFTGPWGAFMNLFSSLITYPAAEPDLLLDAGSNIHGLEVIHVPGHTYGSICLYLPGRFVFTGDTIIADNSGNPRQNFERVTADREKDRASIKALAELDYDILLPGHGTPVIGNACRKVRNICM